MSNEAVVAIMIRLAGIWIFLTDLPTTLRILPAVVGSRGSIISEPIPIPWSYLGVNLLWLVLAAAMVLAPMAFARRLLPKAQWGNGSGGWSLEDFQAVAFSVLGLYFLLTTVTASSGWVTYWAYAVQSARQGVTFEPVAVTVILEALLRIAVGLWLLFGAKGLGRLLRRVRTAG